MKFIIVSILALLLSFSATASPYCLGEWTDDADTYCHRAMIYVQSLTADRAVGRSKRSVRAEIAEVVRTYLIPKNLANNYIEFIWQFEPNHFTPDEIASQLFGGCIDNFEILQNQGIKEATSSK